MVITNLGCYGFNDGEMILTSIHPNCTLEEIRENTGWDVRISPHLTTTNAPTLEELRILREELDTSHLFI
jgi:glutaconate CoA-transferase subunit B